MALEEARSWLRSIGYVLDFEVSKGRLHCLGCGASAHPADVVIEALVPVLAPEGSPGSELVALDCLTCGVKGTLFVDRTRPSDELVLSRLRMARIVGRRGGA